VVLRKVRWLLLLVLVLLALPGAGSAVVQRDAGVVPEVTIDDARFSGTWYEGWFGVWQTKVVRRHGRSDVVWKRIGDGSLKVKGTVSADAQLAVTLRTSAGRVVATSGRFQQRAGRYSRRLSVKRPLPGLFTVSTTVLGSNGVTLKKVDQPKVFPTPPEGVPDRATISATKLGPPAKVLRGRKEAWVRFHFLRLPPNTRTVWIEWRQPNWVHVCQKATGPTPNCKLRKQISKGWVYTYVKTYGGQLARGNWYAQMSVGSKVARRKFVTLR
jgi:hypothetical protein